MGTKSTKTIGVCQGYLEDLENMKSRPDPAMITAGNWKSETIDLIYFMKPSGLLNDLEQDIYTNKYFSHIQDAMAYIKRIKITVRLFIFPHTNKEDKSEDSDYTTLHRKS